MAGTLLLFIFFCVSISKLRGYSTLDQYPDTHPSCVSESKGWFIIPFPIQFPKTGVNSFEKLYLDFEKWVVIVFKNVSAIFDTNIYTTCLQKYLKCNQKRVFVTEEKTKSSP